MRTNFIKMQALGNDFVVIDGVRQALRLSPEQVRRIADRHYGIGCDQVLVAEPATRQDADFFFRIFNCDGGEVQQCGNGARCFALFLRDQGLTHKRTLTVQTLADNMRITLLDNDQGVAVEMGVPEFDPLRIPFIAKARAPVYDLDVDGAKVTISALSLGNPHAVQRVADVDAAPVAEQGPVIERHRRFPEGVNAGFMQILDRAHIRLRVFERGAGETLACGSGACAAVVAGRALGELDEEVEVRLPGGRLWIRWPGEGQPVIMTGPGSTVFEGEIELTEP